MPICGQNLHALAAITYSWMDAYQIIVVHEQRHFQQAKRVTEETGFGN